MPKQGLARSVGIGRRVFLGLASILLLGIALGPAADRAESAPPVPPVYGYEVVHAYPHDPEAFTEGLFYRDGFLYESTGLNGRSSVRKVRLETGEVLQRNNLVGGDFGEGIVDWGNELIGLTWQSGTGFVADLGSFTRRKKFSYSGEGWALTRDDHEIFMSDGTPWLRLLDPVTLRPTGRIEVTDQGHPVERVNELEWVKGEIFANIWETDRIARIDPKTGHVTGWIDLSGLLESRGPQLRVVDVLNGIAYDAAGDRLFVTGKLWPWLFEIRIVPKPDGVAAAASSAGRAVQQ
jgi:glutaminyl-peptide cyclotransferase